MAEIFNKTPTFHKLPSFYPAVLNTGASFRKHNVCYKTFPFTVTWWCGFQYYLYAVAYEYKNVKETRNGDPLKFRYDVSDVKQLFCPVPLCTRLFDIQILEHSRKSSRSHTQVCVSGINLHSISLALSSAKNKI
jgi:hypothetical protein